MENLVWILGWCWRHSSHCAVTLYICVRFLGLAFREGDRALDCNIRLAEHTQDLPSASYKTIYLTPAALIEISLSSWSSHDVFYISYILHMILVACSSTSGLLLARQRQLWCCDLAALGFESLDGLLLLVVDDALLLEVFDLCAC